MLVQQHASTVYIQGEMGRWPTEPSSSLWKRGACATSSQADVKDLHKTLTSLILRGVGVSLWTMPRISFMEKPLKRPTRSKTRRLPQGCQPTQAITSVDPLPLQSQLALGAVCYHVGPQAYLLSPGRHKDTVMLKTIAARGSFKRCEGKGGICCGRSLPKATQFKHAMKNSNERKEFCHLPLHGWSGPGAGTLAVVHVQDYLSCCKDCQSAYNDVHYRVKEKKLTQGQAKSKEVKMECLRQRVLKELREWATKLESLSQLKQPLPADLESITIDQLLKLSEEFYRSHIQEMEAQDSVTMAYHGRGRGASVALPQDCFVWSYGNLGVVKGRALSGEERSVLQPSTRRRSSVRQKKSADKEGRGGGWCSGDSDGSDGTEVLVTVEQLAKARAMAIAETNQGSRASMTRRRSRNAEVEVTEGQGGSEEPWTKRRRRRGRAAVDDGPSMESLSSSSFRSPEDLPLHNFLEIDEMLLESCEVDMSPSNMLSVLEGAGELSNNDCNDVSSLMKWICAD